MRKFGETMLCRLVALLLTLAMLLPSAVGTPAQAQAADWQSVTIDVSWEDAGGNRIAVQAAPIPGSMMQEFWVTVDPLAIRDGVWLTVRHPYHEYSYTPDSQTRLTGLVDAQKIDGMSHQMIMANENGRVVDMYYLYISTLPMPVAEALDVPVIYQDTTGKVIARTTQRCLPNEYTQIAADASMVPGYSLIGETTQGVYVDGMIAIPAEIVFLCETINAAPTQAPVQPVPVPVRYVDEYGAVIYETSVLCYPDQPNAVLADMNAIPGYNITSNGWVDVWVDAYGANPSSVIFQCERIVVETPAPTEIPVQPVDVPVLYVDEYGQVLYQTSVVCQPNRDTTIQARADVVPGYRIVGDTRMIVWVDSHGAAPSSVVFQCEQIVVETPVPTEKPINPVNVPVVYVDAYGNTIYQTSVRCYPDQPTSVLADMNVIPGYNVVSQGWVDVWVDENGAHPSSVVFTCEPVIVATEVPVQPVNVPVLYVDEYGRTIFETSVLCQPFQDSTIRASADDVPGYQIVGESRKIVWVDAHGATPATVVFTCEQIVVPTEAPAQSVRVSVFYMDAQNNVLHETSILCPPNQTTTIVADANAVPGYQIRGQSWADVWVDVNGAVPEVVVFDCEPIVTATAAPSNKPVSIPVIYRDSSGAVVYETTTVCNPNGVTAVYADAGVVPGYTIIGEKWVDVRVDASGAVPATVIFECVKNETSAPSVTVASAQVMVVYQTERGLPLDTQFVTCYSDRKNIITPNSVMVSGYQLTSQESFTITVNEQSQPSQQLVTFVYREVPVGPVEAQVEIVYQYLGVTTVQYSQTVREGEANRIAPDLNRIPAGYTLQDASPVTVTVAHDGSVQPDCVVFALEQLPVETPIPQGEMINRLGQINAARTAVRRVPSLSGNDPVQRLAKGTMVYVLREELNASGESWMRVLIDGQQYFILSSLLDVLTSRESELYMSSLFATPVPPMTADQLDHPQGTQPGEPTPEMLPTLTPAPWFPELLPTQIPTAALLPDMPTQKPTATPTPAPYYGYALTTQRVALRTTIGNRETDILMLLEPNTLVVVTQPGYDPATGEPWSVVTTLDFAMGMLPDSSLRRINDQEAKYYLDLWEQAQATPIPTLPPTSTPEPVQIHGLAASVGDHVPYRNMPSEFSVIMGELMQDEVVYVSGQQYVDNMAWHLVQYGSQWVYVRADMLRMLTREEEDAYLSQPDETPAPTLVIEPQPYDPAGLSSYGYVWDTSVNFRKSPSTSAGRIRTLRQYAFCLVLGSSQQSDGTWYHIDYNGTEGYVHGDYFKQMSINELEEFLNSDEYRQGISNNTSTNTNQNHTTGTGGIISAEDQIVNQWTDPNSGLNVSYAPFNPFATPEPLEESMPTIRPMATPAPTGTPTLAPLPTLGPIYPTVEETDNGWPWGWLVAAALIIVAGSGIYVWLKIRENKRMMAQRAAQRRAQAARAEARPYARSAPNGMPGPYRTGTYPNQHAGVQQAPRRAYAPMPSDVTGSVPVAAERTGQQPALRSEQPIAAPEYANYERAVNPNTGAMNPTSPYRQPASQQTGSYTASYRSGGDTGAHTGRRSVYRQARYSEGDYTASYRAQAPSQPVEKQNDDE